MTPGLPVNLGLEGRRVLVVGGGRIAARKVDALLAAGAEVHVVAPTLGDEIRSWRDEDRLAVTERPFVPGDFEHVWAVFSATDDPEVNRRVFEEGERRRVFVNSADDPAHCSMTLMSIVRRGDLQIAIGTGGRSPALAAALKERLATEIGPE
ncbi:MAG: bifunctional precorrin-2 dehydrogenase/sirohydrochlorin ferrochelatase, partial [Actinobacteria bacterium]|nr:bifunctional precorrin-2 dehydrogenase/sirohydrochlorin ferrochelatase [Actinomycetota bacterium]